MAADGWGCASFELRVLRGGPGAIVCASGVVDLCTAPMLGGVLRELILEGSSVVLDLEEVTLLDAHSIGMLVSTQRSAITHGSSLHLRSAHGRVLHVLEITGSDKLLVDAPEAAAGPEPEDRTVETVLLARCHEQDPRVAGQLRQLAIVAMSDVAIRLARHYRGRGEAVDDLTQVAMIGLIKAVDGFDPERGWAFLPFAIPTIRGELKRHFRDKGWQVRVPRRMQELGLAAQGARGVLSQRLGRAPTTAELAAHLDVDEHELCEAVVAGQAYRPESLSAPAGPGADAAELGDLLGAEDAGFDLVECRESVRGLLNQLSTRAQRILALRYYGNMSQTQIANAVGLSQMHVSRLLTDALNRLRDGLSQE